MTGKPIDQGFQAILGASPAVLILGTMPSVASLASSQYYGHPRNSFWWIMSHLCDFDETLDYTSRVDKVKAGGIAIWDVIHRCHRPGSLDSAIDESTLQANPIAQLLDEHPTIKVIAFNGQAANKLARKHLKLNLFDCEQVCMPSTSPAYAAMTRETKLDNWLTLKAYLR